MVTELADVLKAIILIFYYYIEAFVRLFFFKTEKDVKNKLVVITGAGQGLGRELAIRFGKLNANLALLDINKENLSQTKEYLETEFDSNVRTYVCNVSSEEAVNECLDRIRKDFRMQVEILINNAGIVTCLPFEELDSKSIIRTFEVNVYSQFWAIKNVLPAMKRNNSGHIVAIASIAGHMGNANLTDYCASKFAIVGLMESLREELRQNKYEGIKLTTVNPIAMNTTMFKRPTTRFSSILPVIDVQIVADRTMAGILNEEASFSVPSAALWLHRFSAFVPTKVTNLALDFLDYNVKPHK